MPELPEVETTCRGIAPHIIGKAISQITVRETRLRWPIATKVLNKQLLQQPVLKVSRRAKYILIHVPTGTLVIHLGMSGTLRVTNTQTALKKHDHVDCKLDDSTILRFNDPRRFGAVLFCPLNQNLKQFAHLGLEPLEHEFNGTYLFEKAQKHRTPIKTFIMNQRIVVGVGNIYANEALFLAKIHPMQSAQTVSHEQYHSLTSAIKKILKAAIKKGGTTLKDFKQSDGKPGYFSQALSIYGREGLACGLCKSTIKQIRLSQRSTYYCPLCQKP